MSTETGHVPLWDLADRLRKSLRESGISVQAMADYLEVSRNTIGNWINGHSRPTSAALRLWALRTGVPYGWLRKGDVWGPIGGELTAQLRPAEVVGQLRKQQPNTRSLGVAA